MNPKKHTLVPFLVMKFGCKDCSYLLVLVSTINSIHPILILLEQNFTCKIQHHTTFLLFTGTNPISSIDEIQFTTLLSTHCIANNLLVLSYRHFNVPQSCVFTERFIDSPCQTTLFTCTVPEARMQWTSQ